jgi:hypothetical protein
MDGGMMSILMDITNMRCHWGDKAKMKGNWAFGNLK